MVDGGSRPGYYLVPSAAGAKSKGHKVHPGGKDIRAMRPMVGDYTLPGWTVVDPYAGSATTLIAAAELGCQAIGAEVDPDTYDKAQERIVKGYTPMPHPRASKVAGKPVQGALW